MYKFAIAFFMICFVSATQSHAATRSSCPEKVLDTGQVEGVYQGTECGDFCHSFIRLDNGEDFVMMCGEEMAEKFFGRSGQRVVATFEIQQFWNEFGNECARVEVCKAGGPAQVPRKDVQLPLGRYQQCMGEGKTAEQKCFDGNTLNTTAINPLELGENGQGVYGGYRDSDTPFTYSKTGDTLTFSENMKYLLSSLKIDTVRGKTVLHNQKEAWLHVGEAQLLRGKASSQQNTSPSSKNSQMTSEKVQEYLYNAGLSAALADTCGYKGFLPEEDAAKILKSKIGHLNPSDKKLAAEALIIGAQVGSTYTNPSDTMCKTSIKQLEQILREVR